MTQVKIDPGPLSGSVILPPSKSLCQRVLILALLHQGITKLINSGLSEDERAVMEIIRQWGAVIQMLPDGSIQIQGAGLEQMPDEINCGESGLAARLFIPIAALSAKAVSITGKGTLLKRPQSFFQEILPRLGVDAVFQNGCLPAQIQGPLKPVSLAIDAGISSQFLSGLLLAFAHSTVQPTSLQVTNLKSKPYVDLTLDLLEHFGYNVTHKGYEEFTINPRIKIADTIEWTVEGDWSSGAFMAVAAALSGDVVLSGLSLSSLQADVAILEVLRSCGVKMSDSKNGIQIQQEHLLQSFEFDATETPDLFPPLAVLASQCEGRSAIKGLSRLPFKESDREHSISKLLTNLGVLHECNEDVMMVTGGEIRGGRVETFNDHRICMAGAIAALRASAPVIIDNATCVSKSYPRFFEDLESLGASVTLLHQ